MVEDLAERVRLLGLPGGVRLARCLERVDGACGTTWFRRRNGQSPDTAPAYHTLRTMGPGNPNEHRQRR
ncbi:hypothetical protein GCM10009850_092770 [Nonomuraea monospora]|uniref:Uncharacterized protein n=1 Tax=Nonomuraea monospora TaxID=568818 RepID=A0ABN3CWN2_9ACTN